MFPEGHNPYNHLLQGTSWLLELRDTSQCVISMPGNMLPQEMHQQTHKQRKHVATP